MSSDIAMQVVELIHRQTGIGVDQMRANTDLVINRTVSGDDAVELIECFAKEFDVDMSHYVHDEYFGPEGGDPFSILFYAIVNIWRPLYRPLRVEDLISAARERAWPKPSNWSET
jgi:hypothetical protein